MKKISNFEIIKEILFKDLIKSKILKFIVIPILISTVVYSILEIKACDKIQDLNSAIENHKNENDALKKYILQMIIVVVLSEVNGFVFTGVVQFIYRNMSKSTFKLFISLPPAEFNNIGSGEIQTIIERKAKSSSEIIEIFITNLLPITLKLVFALYSVGMIMGGFAGYIMGVCILIYGAITIGIAIWRANIRKTLNTAENKTCNKLQDSLINHETIIAFRTIDYEVGKYDDFLKENESISNKLWRAFYFLNLAQRLIFISQSFLIIYAGLTGYLSYKMSSGQFIYFMSIASTVSLNLGNLGYLYTRYTQAIINARSSHDAILDLKTESNKKEIQDFKDSIKFSNISFSYENRKVFENLNFEIFKGEKVAIVGSNGSGKSTLMKLFLKFENFTGSILIDNININDINEDSYRKIIGYIPQNTFLFNETVKYNIKYGNENVTDDKIFSLCKKFGLFDLFSNLENGFDTNVGERGRFLSGGEKQKILLMRAMLRNQEILILDEPTAALDKNSEMNLIDAILANKNQTIIMIIHNLELLNRFDKVLHLNNKMLKEICKHEKFSQSLVDLIEKQN